ncbi:hypothetical protein BDW75DRAFT_176389 [Aspergillus navahoensis]
MRSSLAAIYCLSDQFGVNSKMKTSSSRRTSDPALSRMMTGFCIPTRRCEGSALQSSYDQDLVISFPRRTVLISHIYLLLGPSSSCHCFLPSFILQHPSTPQECERYTANHTSWCCHLCPPSVPALIVSLDHSKVHSTLWRTLFDENVADTHRCFMCKLYRRWCGYYHGTFLFPLIGMHTLGYTCLLTRFTSPCRCHGGSRWRVSADIREHMKKCSGDKQP